METRCVCLAIFTSIMAYVLIGQTGMGSLTNANMVPLPATPGFIDIQGAFTYEYIRYIRYISITCSYKLAAVLLASVAKFVQES
jgi:hypothetical protein